MDVRVDLTNKISQDILSSSTIFKDIKGKVDQYSIILDDTIRNFYEIETMEEVCPLFQLCYYLRQGKSNFCMDQNEYEEAIKGLVASTNTEFNLTLSLDEVLEEISDN